MLDPDAPEEQNLSFLLEAGVLIYEPLSNTYTLDAVKGEQLAPEFTANYQQALYLEALDYELEGYLVEDGGKWEFTDKARELFESLPNG